MNLRHGALRIPTGSVDPAVIIRTRFKTKPLKQWKVKREFYRRVKWVFDERGIEIPFSHRAVYMGEPKKGNGHNRTGKNRYGIRNWRYMRLRRRRI